MKTDDARRTVLVVAHDPVIASLMTSLTELAGFTPIARAADESVGRALARLAPTVLLLDIDEGAALRPELYARADELATRVVLFTSSHTEREIGHMAVDMGVPSFALPIHPAALRGVLEGALASGAQRARVAEAVVPRAADRGRRA